ncbi:ABATE domain-containing protein [Tsukamurella sp. NPDC003166]|uniref:CGNR zinc finger domain-containing protein n=1 Tax=Tsukamurella sp. NPDC003166 TaxID=3154444 RepID=UPI0033B92EF6
MTQLRVPSDVVESADQRRHGFPFRSGSVALDFVATVAKRDMADREMLADADAFVDWLYVAGLPAVTTAVTPEAVRRARRLREAIHRLIRARVDGEEPAPADIELINDAARPRTPTALLAPSGRTALPADGVTPTAILALLARQGVELLTGPYGDRIRRCLGHDCSLYFVDRSRQGNRTWCSMSACGAKNSSARYRSRHRHQESRKDHHV